MYVILTNKPGKFTTHIGEGLRPVKAFDYLFCGRKTASYLIAELLDDTARICIVEEGGTNVNTVPVKFLPRFPTVERAIEELGTLTTFATLDTALQPATWP